MNLPDQVIDAMVDAGCTAQQIAAAVKAANACAPSRSVGAERQARYRDRKAQERNKSVTRDARNVTVTDTPPSPPFPDKERSPTPPKEINPIPPLPPHSLPGAGEMAGSQDEFDWFWSLYPHKVQIKSARGAFQFARLKADLPTILEAVQRYAAKTDDRPWMNPARWLEDECWLDQPAQPPPRRGGRAESKTDAAIQRFVNRGEDHGQQDQENDLRNVFSLPAIRGD